jgi:phage tail-like protein
MPSERANYIGGRFTLELDDKKPVGFVTTIDGGHYKSDMIQSPIGGRPGQEGGDFYVQKYPGKPKHEDVTVTTGMAMSPQFWKWIESTVANKPQRRDGALVTYDFDNKERLRRTFSRALISEVTFPACDAASKNGQLLTVKFSPEKIDYAEGDKSTLKMDQGLNETAKVKKWIQSAFRFGVDKIGDEKAFNQAKIEAFTIKQNVIQNPNGKELLTRKEPGKVELPTLQVTVPESQGKAWFEWFDKTSSNGNHETSPAHLTYLSPNGDKELLRIEFRGVGLLSIDFDKLEAGREGVQRIKATLFIEGISIKPGEGTA